MFVRENKYFWSHFNRPSKLDWSSWIIARQIRHFWGMCFLPFVYPYFIHDKKFRSRISETVPNSSRTPLARQFLNFENRSGILTNMSRFSTIISKTPVNIFGTPKNISGTAAKRPRSLIKYFRIPTRKNSSGTPTNSSAPQQTVPDTRHTVPDTQHTVLEARKIVPEPWRTVPYWYHFWS